MSGLNFDETLSLVMNGDHSKTTILTLLKTIRINKIRESRIVIEFGTKALEKFGNGLGDEKWTILEQVFLAALDTNNAKLADDCIQQLIAKFKTDSSRVNRLLGMQNESLGHYDMANETYDKLLETNPANGLVLKRKVAMFKGQGKMDEAVKELNKYLEQMPGDVSAWQELADMYLSISKYDAAAFCCEELILHDPMNHILHCRLAEIYYTMGAAHYANARKYFAQSLEIKKKNNARALYGLTACCQAMSEQPNEKQHARDVSEALHNFARNELTSLYRTNNPGFGEVVEAVLEEQEASMQN